MNYESDREIRREALDEAPSDDSSIFGGESHATTGGAAAAGAVTGGVIGLTGGPVGAAIGAVGGAIVGAAAERMMHGDDGDRPASQRRARHADESYASADSTTPVYADNTPFDRHPVEQEAAEEEENTPTEVDEPVGEPLAEVEPEAEPKVEPKQPRPLI